MLRRFAQNLVFCRSLRPGWLCLVWLVLGCNRTGPAQEQFQGIVELEQRYLAFEVGGRVTSVQVRRGDDVDAGALVATLDPVAEQVARLARYEEASAARSQLELIEAGARPEEISALASRLNAATASEKLLEKNFARERSLHDKGVTPQERVDELETQYERAKAERQALAKQLAILRKGARKQEVQSASARAEAANAAVKLEDVRLGLHELRVPSDGGRVLERHVEPGEVVMPGTPVITLGDVKRPYVEVFVPQNDLDGIKTEIDATVQSDSLRHPLHGKVEYIAQRTEFTPRFLFSERERPNLVIRVRVVIDDPKQELHAGVPAFVRFDRRRGKP
ncbi:MAG: HlyD family efflux transporter periplasmic adaptor subunit [Myxococcales bacterium]|nr:MAG: HlyD family efflux transporter periplasmic adaptor subunit [Myxococcales bacterium]